MLTSVISTTATSIVSSASAGAISMMAGVGLPEYGLLVLAVIALILLLSAKEILSASNYWNKEMKCSLNMGIFPLLISFCAIVVFKVVEML